MSNIDEEKLIKFKDALADIIVSSQGICTYQDCKDIAEREASSLIGILRQEQPECVEKTARISPGMLSNFGTSTYVLDVDLTQDEMAKVALFGFNSGKIKIKIVCE